MPITLRACCGTVPSDSRQHRSGLTQALEIPSRSRGLKRPQAAIVVVEALTKGIKTEHFERMAGPETHGLRPSLDSWQPTTRAEATHYLVQCARLLAEFATVDDEAGASARYELAEGFRSFISSELIGIDVIEAIALRVRDHRGHWPEAIRALESHLTFDEGADAQSERVEGLIDQLQPQDLALRTLDLVSQFPGMYGGTQAWTTTLARTSCARISGGWLASY